MKRPLLRSLIGTLVLLTLSSLSIAEEAAAQEESSNLPSIDREELRQVVSEFEEGSLSEREYIERFEEAISMVRDVRVEQQIRVRYADNLPEARRGEAYRRIAEVSELLGDFDQATDYYGRAAELSDFPHSYALTLRQAMLLHELGRTDEARSAAETVLNATAPVTVQREAALLLARIYSSRDEHDAALDLLSGLTDTRPLSHVRPEVLLAYYEAATRAGATERAAEARQLLEEAYPESPELALVDDSGTVSYFPAPSRLFGGTEEIASLEEISGATTATGRERVQQKEGETGTLSGTTEGDSPGSPNSGESAATERTGQRALGDGNQPDQPPQQGATGVQVGSFTNRANAQAMVSELGQQNFEARINSISLGDTTYYRVVVAAGEEQSATDLQFRLKTEGYDGILIFNEG